jgi:transcription antitermination factor NusG
MLYNYVWKVVWRGKAAETVKGLVYSEVAYEAAKNRLIRKYGGVRRNVQAHLDVLLRMRQISEANPKELERFADILERTVVTLKENRRESDLKAGTLYDIVLDI